VRNKQKQNGRSDRKRRDQKPCPPMPDAVHCPVPLEWEYTSIKNRLTRLLTQKNRARRSEP
jgi:hypothetical protein